ncbi:MAG: ankyrin repeat domain-containing protein [Pirellulaceae bacterium]|nr:ankyrin repeat domain-containing protein [Pirellulaceae bacterium]
MRIHEHAAAGDLDALERAIDAGASVEARDKSGQTPLMIAAASPRAGLNVLRLLVDRGANIHALSAPTREESAVQSVLSIAAKGANLEKIKLLIAAGADVEFVDSHGYSILLYALYGSYAHSTTERLALLGFLVDAGASLDAASSHGETVLRVSSMHGDFRLAKYFLDRGADPRPLDWSPLFLAVAFGSPQDVKALVNQGADLNQTDAWERTPFLLSVHAGRLEIARLLLASGSNRRTTGRCGQTALMLAISRNDAPMLEWLVSEGWDVEETNDFGDFPLVEAAKYGAVECLKVLLQAGAVASRRDKFEHGAINSATSPEIVDLLLSAGEDLSDVDSEMRSKLTRIERHEEFELSPADFLGHRDRTFGKRNPERMYNPFWDAMVRTRASAYTGASKFEERNFDKGPVWCFQRYGQSLTRLPDGRFVEIAGEHEDHYDPDFCIYNDVVVHHGDGTFDIFGYPEADFPTTDFHSATLVPPYIYIIGNLGYPWQRRPGETPVYRLDCETWRIRLVQTTGIMPGWIHRHKAQLVNERSIRISGGKLIAEGSQELIDNSRSYLLDLADFTWRLEAPKEAIRAK